MSLAAGLRRGRAILCESLGLNALARRRLDGQCAAILYYHRVIPEEQARRDHVEPGMYVTPESFALQLDWLSRHFHVMPLHEICSARSEGRTLPRGACAITFDDGWLDNHEHALPALSRRGVPATVFVVTERVGTEGAFWPDEVARRLQPLPRAEQLRLARSLSVPAGSRIVDEVLEFLKQQPEDNLQESLEELRRQTDAPASRGRELMNWDELERLSRAGIDIESHCATHAILTSLTAGETTAELRESLASLLARGHGRHRLLAYPSGSFDRAVIEATREAGYRAAVSTVNGLATPAADAFALPRLCVHQGISGSREEFLFRVPGRA